LLRRRNNTILGMGYILMISGQPSSDSCLISLLFQTLINNDAGFSEFGAQSNGHFEDPGRITTAVFYSITSTQKGNVNTSLKRN
jgi:6-phosphogluconate dehydrogenase (decarboxylating)